MANTEVLVLALFVDAGAENDVALRKLRKQVSGSPAVGVVDGGHGVRVTVALLKLRRDQLLEPEPVDRILDVVRRGLVARDALRQRHLAVHDRAQALVQSVDEVRRGRRKVSGRAAFVRLHDGDPASPRCEEGRRRRLAGLARLHSARAKGDKRQTRRAAEAFLRRSEHHVDAPLLHLQLFARDTAHGVDDNERVGAHLLYSLRDGLDVVQHSRAGVDMRDGDRLVLLLLQDLLDLVDGRARANAAAQLRHLGGVHSEAVRKALGEEARVQHQHLFTRLDKVRRNLVPAKRARAGDDDWLRARRTQQVTEHLERLAEDWHKLRRGVSHRRVCVRQKHIVRDLNGSGDHQELQVSTLAATHQPCAGPGENCLSY